MARGGRVNFNELRKFQRRVQNAEKQVKLILVDAAKEIANEFLMSVIARTPEGQVKQKWVCDFNVVESGGTYEITIENQSELASFIEYGSLIDNTHFIQGKFMMKITEEQIKNSLDSVTRRKVENFLKSIF